MIDSGLALQRCRPINIIEILSQMKALRRKMSFKIEDERFVLIKKKQEREEHVLMKIFTTALYYRHFPDLKIEVRLPDERKYKPDILSVDAHGQPLFWGECGKVGVDKLEHLFKRYRRCHFAIAKWSLSLESWRELIAELLEDCTREAPVDLIGFPDKARHCMDPNGDVRITFEDVVRYRFRKE